MVSFFIEELESDVELQFKQARAERYASEPDRFSLLFMEMEVKADHGNKLVMYSDDGDWSCTCDFFQQERTCSHVMAVGLVLEFLNIVQPRGNVE